MKRRGRPTVYDEAIAQKICFLTSTQSVGIKRLCKTHKDLPKPATVYAWLIGNEEFSGQYARAKKLQAQLLFDQIIEIADTPQMGSVIHRRANGQREVRHGDMIEHRRLQIDARKWVCARLEPKKYGDRVEVTHDTDPLKELIGEFQKQYEQTQLEDANAALTN